MGAVARAYEYLLAAERLVGTEWRRCAAMTSGDVLMRIDDGGRVIDWSPSADEVFG
ncbi:hypothetical protein ACWC9U_27170 [Streptomyces sp. 900116325]